MGRNIRGEGTGGGGMRGGGGFWNSPRGSCWEEGSSAEAAAEATEEATARIRAEAAEAQPGEAAKSLLLRRGRGGGVGIILERNSTKHEFLKSIIQRLSKKHLTFLSFSRFLHFNLLFLVSRAAED